MLWNTADGSLVTSVRDEANRTDKVAFLDTSTLVTTSHRGSVTSWNIDVALSAQSSTEVDQKLKPVHTATIPNSETVLAMSQNGEKVAFDTDTEFLVIWDVVRAKKSHSFISIGTRATEFSFDGSHIATPMGIYDLNEKHRRLEYQNRGAATAIAFSRDNSAHVTADGDWIAAFGEHSESAD